MVTTRLILNLQAGDGLVLRDSEVEEILREFITWMKNPNDTYHPGHEFGDCIEPCFGKDDWYEDNWWNYSEWVLDVDSELIILVARVLLAEGFLLPGELEVWVDNDKVHLDDEGFFGPNSKHEGLTRYMDLVRRLICVA